jgi:hypothetical protein
VPPIHFISALCMMRSRRAANCARARSSLRTITLPAEASPDVEGVRGLPKSPMFADVSWEEEEEERVKQSRSAKMWRRVVLALLCLAKPPDMDILKKYI